MASISEKTFGSRIANAETLSSHLSGFTAYVPARTEDSVPNYKTLITAIKANNKVVANTKTAYSQAVDKRVKLFSKTPESMPKTLTLIAGAVKAKFGKNSQEAKLISALIIQIRGESSKKLKKDDLGEFVSQSVRSYGSQTQSFADIIATLTSFGTDYEPANVKIKINALDTQLTNLNTANENVAIKYALYKPAIETRLIQYQDLKDRSDRIKESIKSQYTTSSTEYKLIKGLKI